MSDSDFLCKIILIGDQCVGKTSILSRFVSNKFSELYHATIGVDFLIKHVRISEKKLKCQFWDASGSEKYRSIISAYFKGANAIIAVYDITNRASFDSIKSQLDCYKSHMFKDTAILVVGNKSDLEDQRLVTKEELDEYTDSNNFLGAEVTAKNDFNLVESVTDLVKQVYYKNEHKLIKLVTSSTRKSMDTFTLPKLTQSITENEEVNCGVQQGFQSKSEFLNANSNSFLFGSGSFYNKSQNKNIIADLVEQVSTLKNENQRQSELISNLNSIDHIKSMDALKVNEDSSAERSSIEALNKELNSIKIKYQKMVSELTIAREKDAIKDSTNKDLKQSIETLKSANATLETDLADQQNKIKSLLADLETYEIVSGKSELTINTLQVNNNELTEEINKLKSEINSIRTEWETCQNSLNEQTHLLKSNQADISEITQVLHLDTNSNTTIIKEKIQAIIAESADRQTNVTLANEKIVSTESANKVNADVVDRLVAELNASETALLTLKQEIECQRINLTSEREGVLTAKKALENEFECFKCEHVSCGEDLESLNTELEAAKAKNLKQEEDMDELNKSLISEQNRYLLFKQEVSKFLSDREITVEPNENVIKETIQCLVTSCTDRGILISSLEDQIASLTSHLQKEKSLRTETSSANSEHQSKITEMQNSIRSLQTNLTAIITTREQLNTERSQFSEFFQNLSSILRLSHSFDKSNQNKVIKRVTELVALESDATRVQNKLNSSDFEGRVKSMEEELANKELHMNILRKKIVDLEEGNFGKVYGKSELKSEYNDMLMMTKKQKFKIDKITGEYNALKAENTLLKAEAMDNIHLSEDIVAKDAIVKTLMDQINELSEKNDKLMVKLNDSRENGDSLGFDLTHIKQSSDETIRKLSQELRDTKQELLKTEGREKQLLEFRDIVSKKLGLNIAGFTLGEYEYVANIQNVLNAPQHAGIVVQQAQSVILGNSELGVPSARPCVECPSWSECVVCMSKCACTCACQNTNNREVGSNSPRKLRPMTSNKHCYSSSSKQDSFQYEN